MSFRKPQKQQPIYRRKFQNAARATRFTSDSFKILQRLCDALNFAPIFCVFWFSKCREHSTVYSFFVSERREITTRFSDMIPNLANTLQLQMLALHCCKILSDGKAPCNELMLHHTRQCTGASCKMLQMLRGLDSNSRPKTKILYTDAFTQRYFHKNSFYTVVSTYTCVYPKMVLHTNTFTHRCFAQGCFYTKKQLHTDVRALLNTDAFTLRCC